jgi:hypothetical protein
LKLNWNEIGETVLIKKKLFYRLLKWIKKDVKIEILSHTGKKPKI